MNGKPQVLKAKDICDSHVVEKGLLPSIPYRFILCGRSGSGKSSLLSCMVALPSWYGDDFKGDNIYIWSGSKGDNKINNLVDFKEIPKSNLRHEWHDGEVSVLYEDLLDDWREKTDKKEKPNNILFIIDDMFFSNKFRSEAAKDSMMAKVYQNGRKFGISIIVLLQKYSSCSTSVREQANAIITFGCTNKQLGLMQSDWNYLPSSDDFYRVFRSATEMKHDWLYINIDQPLNQRYMDKNFDSLYPFKTIEKNKVL